MKSREIMYFFSFGNLKQVSCQIRLITETILNYFCFRPYFSIKTCCGNALEKSWNSSNEHLNDFTEKFLYCCRINPYPANIFLSWKCGLLIASAIHMHSLWTLIRLLHREQPDLGTYCLQSRLPKYISGGESRWKCCLLIESAAYIHMHSRKLFLWKQTLWTLFRLLHREQSDLGTYCLQYLLPKFISRGDSRSKCCLLIASAAYIHMHSRTLLPWKQTIWTLWEQSDLGPYCLPKYISRWEQTEKMWSAYWVCCIYSYALQNTFTVEAYTMNPDQTAPLVWSGSILFAKVHKQMRANKRCGLLIASAAYRTLLTWKQTLWTLIRLVAFIKVSAKYNVKQTRKQTTIVVNGGKRIDIDMGLNARKPVLEVSDKARLKPVSSATGTS